MLRRRASYKIMIFSILTAFLLAVSTFYSGAHVDPLGFAPSSLGYWPLLRPLEVKSDLQRLCDQTEWRDGLWIQCHSNARVDSEGKKSVHGGLNNVRNRIQTCLRVAIDAGAGVVIPSVATRNQTNLKNLGGGEPIPASNFWNMEYMEEALREQCPQLRVRYEFRDIKTRLDAPKRHYKHARYQNGTFGQMTLSLMEKAGLDVNSITSQNPVAISFGDSFLAWDYEKSDELATIRKDLYKTIVYNQTLLDISSQILRSPQLKDGFIGTHIRCESDWPHSFGNSGDQMRMFIQEMEGLERNSPSDLRTVYASCGNRTGIEIFRQKVALLGYQVHDKWSLLSEDSAMLATVDGLMFDMKGVVEYQVLLNSNFFLGPVMSSMSSLIAFTRALDETATFFPTYIFPGSKIDPGEDGLGIKRRYPKVPVMKGDSRSKLMLVNGDDIMSFFP